MSFHQSSGGFSADAVSPSGNSPYYNLTAPTGDTSLFQPIVPDALVASATTPYYNLVNGSLQQGSTVNIAPISGPVSDSGLGYTDSKAMGVSVSGAANVPIPGAVGYGVSAVQYAKDTSYFVLSGGEQGNPPSTPPPPDSFPLATTPGGQGLVLFFSNAGQTGEEPIIYSFLYGTVSPPTSSALATKNNPAISIYGAAITGLTANTQYYVQTVATNVYGTAKSSIVTYTTPTAGTAPGGALSAPTLVGNTSTSITVTVNASAVTGTPTPKIILVYFPPSGNPANISAPDFPPVANVYTFTIPGLTPSTNYTVQGYATNGTSPDLAGPQAPFSTTAPTPIPELTTNCVVPFLIQGPRFNTPYATALDYYVNVDAVGCELVVGATAISGTQDYGYMYGGSIVTPPAPSNAGLCTADQPYSTTYGIKTDDYFENVGTTRTNRLICWGGFYADILGLFAPYQPANFPTGATNPASIDVIRSFCYNYLNITAGNTNPLNWSRSGWSTNFDGLILDFENVGLGGRPSSNQYPLPQSPAPAFPADATNPTYSGYITILQNIPSDYHAIAPTKFLGNAPASLCINGDLITFGSNNGNVGAANTALNTWFAFSNSTTVPSATTYNSAASGALNHPSVMKYFDDIFVQFYNENPDFYPGGSKFPNLLAQWGYVALLAQQGNIKKTRINIGLAKGNIIPGGSPAVDASQGPTPQLSANPPPFEFWYPQYYTDSPPNATTAAQNALYWPNTGKDKDPKNIRDAIADANAILQTAFKNPNLLASDWLSGVGFWAGTAATAMAKSVYTMSDPASPGPTLPSVYTYCFSDASYPSPAPNWVGNVPITKT